MSMADMRRDILLTGIIAFVIISVALASEIFGGLLPCALCLKQRVPYYVALPLLLLAYFYAPHAPRAISGLLSTVGIIFLGGAALAAYHAGIEYGFWAGPASCGGGGGISGSTDALMAALKKSSIVRCDAPAWTLFSISFAGYNVLASLALAVLALRHNPHPYREETAT